MNAVHPPAVSMHCALIVLVAILVNAKMATLEMLTIQPDVRVSFGDFGLI